MKTILSVIPLEADEREKLEAAADGCEIIYSTPETVTEAQVQSANIILGNVPSRFIHGSEKLELLQLNSAGTDDYMPAGVLNEKTILTNATGAYSQAVSEHMFAMLLALIKKLHLYRDEQARSRWHDRGTVRSLSNMTVLVVGLGDIGTRFAALCKVFGAYVIGVKRRMSALPDCVDELHLTAELKTLLPRADVILSILPNTPDTRGAFDYDTFKLMKRDAVFLNGGRGSSVVTDDLVRALQEGLIYAAGIDVCEPEPLPPEHPLWAQENILITPHVSGTYHLTETRRRIAEIAIYNADAQLHGGKLKNIIDMSTRYKR